ncbi:prepilin-type N-terminal cleavage/methylation domain-containing protein [Roseateles sp. SL47]|jgi:type IV pilus assembly protein PilV|uniref:type IV pilus modification PilV family protein n=1 Tax=Roseateles sp. SL47 TaxID=2995138 RepID=UPI00226F4F9F|nr:prepilin-type N-terminal cleavage/methylation domain-containing protein [Roseateles sp. SL47]WAC73253.1 prepilin-type N-terminal cleavage/methylation domain-containing protein [Roseateles sp. SL47]
MKPTFRPLPARRRARGMTLIEVLCAILVMTLGLLGLVSVMAKASQATVATDDAQRAASLANELATEMWLRGTVNVPTATLNAWRTRVSTASDMGLPSGVGAVSQPNTSINFARITITWTPPGATNARQYFTDVRLNN